MGRTKTIAKDQIPYVCLENAKVQAFTAPIVQHPIGYRGGPILSEAALEPFRHHRGNKVIDHFSPEISPTDFISGDLIYAGPIYDHFGHFMAEMIHRILPARSLGLQHKFLFVGARGHAAHATYEGFPQHIQDILSFLGLSAEDVVIALDDVIVERLHLVPQASQHHGDPADWYLDLLEVYSNEVLDRRYRDIVRPKRLYVSRTKQALEGGLLGETFLERWLQGVGFEPFYPESHSFSEQMDCYRKAEYVIFAQGSACHGTELLGRRGLRSAILIPKSIKSDFFRRILYPRSRRFSVAGSPNQIGTMYYNSETRFQYIHLGVSLVDFPALAGCLKADGIAPPRVKPWAYRLAAAHDLRRYIAGAFQENGADLRQAARLIIAFLTKAFRTKGMSSD